LSSRQENAATPVVWRRHIAVSRAVGAIRRPTRYERLTLGLIVAVLTLVPALISATHTRSKVQIGLAPLPHAALVRDTPVSYVTRMVGPDLRLDLALLASQSAPYIDKSFARTVRVFPAAGGSGQAVTIRGTSTSPVWALSVLRVIGAKIAATSRADFAFWERARTVDLPAYEHTLARHDLSPAARKRLLAVVRFVKGATGAEPPATPLQVGKATVTRNGVWGKITAAMPGHPQSANPIWAGVAGFILAIALCFVWLSRFSWTQSGCSSLRSPVEAPPDLDA
jgi:hypothetical protein